MDKKEKRYLKKKQTLAYKALCEVDRILTVHEIQYYLLSGSVLGAVRHGGFIPWDDDIDIGIFYKDTNKTAKLLTSELGKGFSYIDRTVNSKYPRLYGKVLFGDDVCIDIFPLVKTSNHAISRFVQWFSRKILFKLYKAKLGYSNHNENRNFVEKMKLIAAKVVSELFKKETIEKWIVNTESRYESLKNNQYYVNLYSAYSLKKEMIKSRWLIPAGKIQFCGKDFPVVNDVDHYLTHLYGDYMKLPPKSAQHPRHEEKFRRE